MVPGAALSLERHPALSFIFFGDEARIAPLLAERPALAAKSRIVHTSQVVSMHEKPSQALRRGKGSSMWLTLEAVKKGEAHAAVSAGNTGALMAMAKLILRPMAGIERPAIAALWPTITAECIVLDVGANIGATARQLCDFTLMGAAMARALFHIERPTAGLLNVGVEEIKGAEEVKEANTLLKAVELPLDYRGFIEGNEIGQGRVDVVVVEGFAGNIALKTAEGTARADRTVSQGRDDADHAVQDRRVSRARRLPRAEGKKMDPRRVNGGTFLGLNGIAVKSHGGTDALGFASAVDLGYEMSVSGLLERLAADLEAFHHRLGKSVTASETQAAPLGPQEAG